MTQDNERSGLSRRRLLGGLGSLGAAGAFGGAATTSLLWDEEKFGNADDPNVLQGGELDLKVDWEGTYYNWIDNPTISSDTDGDGEPDEVDQPGPIVDLADLKPGDVMELTLSAHVYGNPAFLGTHCEEFLDSDNGMPEPEDKVDGHTPNDADGTEDGDLDEYVNVAIWHDDGDNLPDEVFPALDGDDNGELDVDEEEYVMAIADEQGAEEYEDLYPETVVFSGTLAELKEQDDFLLKAANSNATDTNEPTDGTDTDPNLAAEEFGEWCYEASATEYLGVLAWLPRDLPGVNDNVIQTDRLEFQFGLDAVQCRHNVADDGMPIDGSQLEADLESGCADADAIVASGGTGDFTSIQAAIDAAAAGDVICVTPGTYEEEVEVDTAVTLRGATSPYSSATVDGLIEVSADGATVRRLRVAPSITYTADNWDRPGSPYGILATGDDVLVEGNVVEGMTADASGGFVSMNGIQVFHAGSDPLSGVVVRDNAVRNMRNEGGSSWPNYGGAAAIKVQGVLDGVDVVGNAVTEVHSAGWTFGIVSTESSNAPGVSPADVTVRGHSLAEINDGSVYDVFDAPNAAPYPGTGFGMEADATEATLRANNFVQIPNAVENKDDTVLDARCNWWGDASGPGTSPVTAGADPATDADGGDPADGSGTWILLRDPNGGVNFDPWLVERFDSGDDLSSICSGGSQSPP